MSKTLLLTGIGGFIGSHVMEHVLINTDWNIVGIDSFRHKGITDRVTTSVYYWKHRERVRIVTHDLTAPFSDLLTNDIGPVDYVVNMASESHVDRSITYPVPFIKNNVDLVLNMLEYARVVKPKAFVQISTDEVYGPMENNVPHPEWDPILPSNPYSASKAAQEAIAISYWRTYKLPLIITNTMNNYGEKQDPEKFLPLIIRKLLTHQVIPIHGKAGNIGSRFWLHARNHADAIIYLLQNTTPAQFPDALVPDRYNVVGERQINNLDVAVEVSKVLKLPIKYQLIDFHSTRPGHDPHYGLTGNKIAELGWKAPVSFDDSLAHTIRWYKENPVWLGL